jgi:hypothetical protein
MYICIQGFYDFMPKFQGVIPEIIPSEKLYINMGMIIDSYRTTGRENGVSVRMQPPRSPDLNPFHFHMWSYMNVLVYEGKRGHTWWHNS